MQFSGNHDNSSRLIIGGLGLSLIGLLSFGFHRVVNALRGRKDTLVARHNPTSRAMICAPASGAARASAVQPVRAKQHASEIAAQPAETGKTASSNTQKIITVTGIFKVVGRLKAPDLDDQLVYLDE